MNMMHHFSIKWGHIQN